MKVWLSLTSKNTFSWKMIVFLPRKLQTKYVSPKAHPGKCDVRPDVWYKLQIVSCKAAQWGDDVTSHVLRCPTDTLVWVENCNFAEHNIDRGCYRTEHLTWSNIKTGTNYILRNFMIYTLHEMSLWWTCAYNEPTWRRWERHTEFDRRTRRDETAYKM
jgi:hypothetical protein